MSSIFDSEDFYPTPPRLISRMLAGINWDAVSAVGEFSAGKGDIALRVAKMIARARLRRRWRDDDSYADGLAAIDCIEINETLRNTLKGAGLRVVHDDFLTYQTRKRYDLIVLNPPFSDGARHLLKALELAQYGGQVRCLLNAETLKNQYSYERKTLGKKLKDLGATVTYLKGEFSDAERPTDVEVALVSVDIPSTDPDSIILEDLREAQKADEVKRGGPTEIAPGDFVDAVVARYRFEVDAGVRLIHEYSRIRPHLLDSLHGGEYSRPILELTIDERKAGGGNQINSYLRMTRKKYWEALFENPQFTKQLTSNLQRELAAKVEALADYEFSKVNILSLQRDMSKQTIASIEETILKQFDDLSRKYAWTDGSENNVHYYDGWATNKALKIGEKVIQPGHGWDTIWHRWDYSRGAQELIDLEKCLTFLNGGLPPEVTISQAMASAAKVQQSQNIQASFFSVTFYKKGTCHIRFARKDLLDRLNIFGGQRKNWLPPSYGKRKYADMDQRERAVVDSFQGQAEYAKVVADPEKYIVETDSMLQLAGVAA